MTALSSLGKASRRKCRSIDSTFIQLLNFWVYPPYTEHFPRPAGHRDLEQESRGPPRGLPGAKCTPRTSECARSTNLTVCLTFRPIAHGGKRIRIPARVRALFRRDGKGCSGIHRDRHRGSRLRRRGGRPWSSRTRAGSRRARLRSAPGCSRSPPASRSPLAHRTPSRRARLPSRPGRPGRRERRERPGPDSSSTGPPGAIAGRSPGTPARSPGPRCLDPGAGAG
jgi:hypothetical protein